MQRGKEKRERMKEGMRQAKGQGEKGERMKEGMRQAKGQGEKGERMKEGKLKLIPLKQNNSLSDQI
jgi:hypothetical protein